MAKIGVWDAENGQPKALFEPAFGDPKDIATKRGEDISGTQLYSHADFHADRAHRCRDTCHHTNRDRVTTDDISDKNAYQRLSDNKMWFDTSGRQET